MTTFKYVVKYKYYFSGVNWKIFVIILIVTFNSDKADILYSCTYMFHGLFTFLEIVYLNIRLQSYLMVKIFISFFFYDVVNSGLLFWVTIFIIFLN